MEVWGSSAHTTATILAGWANMISISALSSRDDTTAARMFANRLSDPQCQPQANSGARHLRDNEVNQSIFK